MAKATSKHEIIIEKDGKQYKGTAIIEGTRKLFLTVHYQSHWTRDSHPYQPNEVQDMLALSGRRSL